MLVWIIHKTRTWGLQEQWSPWLGVPLGLGTSVFGLVTAQFSNKIAKGNRMAVGAGLKLLLAVSEAEPVLARVPCSMGGDRDWQVPETGKGTGDGGRQHQTKSWESMFPGGMCSWQLGQPGPI